MRPDPVLSDLHEETLHSEPLVQGQFLQVYRDIADVPGKGLAVREFVRHPGAAAVVPLFDDGTILLVRQYRYAPGQEFLEVPAGKMELGGEDPASTARRELEEETGHVAEQLTPLGVLNPCIGYSDEVIHFFLAEGLRATEMRLDDTEQLVPVRISFEEACGRARRGELADMKTMAALLMAEAALARRTGAC